MSAFSRFGGGTPRPGGRIAGGVVAGGLVVLVIFASTVAYLVNHAAEHVVDPLVAVDSATQRVLTPTARGKPQTILLTGLDHRYADGKDAKSRSDTMLLVRLDPKAKATAILSLPRDLRVPALGPPSSDKLNSAWFIGGSAKLTQILKTTVLGTPQDPFPINDVVSVKFDAFSQMVNYFHCLYAEVDRKYFIAPNTGHSAIDQPAGYQLLCGQAALAYVRFRVQDSDFVREARQANYITEIRSQINPVQALTGGLIKQIGKYVGTNVKKPKQLLAIAKLALGVAGKPTARIKLGDLSDAKDGTNDVLTTPAALKRARDQFLHPQVAKQQTKKASTGSKTPKKRRAKKVKGAIPASMTTDTAGATQSAATIRQGVTGLDVYAPTVRYGRGAYESDMTRGYEILDKGRHPKWPSYRIVATTGDNGQYYGVEGTTWKDPPILGLTTDEIRLGGRTWRVQYDGRNIRRLIWQGPTGTYWVTNTLTDELSAKEMYAVAKSVKLIE